MQRTGRVQRPGRGAAHVAYTLVSRGTREVANPASRRACMDGEGYRSQVVVSTATRADLAMAATRLQEAFDAVGVASWGDEGEGGDEGGEEGAG